MGNKEIDRYYKILYLGMFLTENSPRNMPKGIWEPALHEDRFELVENYVANGYLERTGNTTDGYPQYRCTQKGRDTCEKYLKVDCDQIFSEIKKEQQSALVKFRDWFVPAVAGGIIGNRADALFVSFATFVERSLVLAIAVKIPVTVTLSS